jgi:hypothetical protein
MTLSLKAFGVCPLGVIYAKAFGGVIETTVVDHPLFF